MWSFFHCQQAEGDSAAAIHQVMIRMHEANCVSDGIEREWCQKFKYGRKNINMYHNKLMIFMWDNRKWHTQGSLLDEFPLYYPSAFKPNLTFVALVVWAEEAAMFTKLHLSTEWSLGLDTACGRDDELTSTVHNIPFCHLSSGMRYDRSLKKCPFIDQAF